jgi:tetratricopeptide (TPR) repeat protein
MDESQKEFLTILGYFFLQNNKAEKALIIFRALQELFPDDPYLMKAGSYACLVNGEHEDALHLAERWLREGPVDRMNEIGYLLKSKALWGLGRENEARETLNQFFHMREHPGEVEPQ